MLGLNHQANITMCAIADLNQIMKFNILTKLLALLSLKSYSSIILLFDSTVHQG